MFTKEINLKITIAFLFTVLFCLNSVAQDWDIPANRSAKNSYIPFTSETSKAGEALYTRNCQSCHGNPGKGNMLKTLKPMPPDMASAITQARSDGDLFYILYTGRLLMPSFKNILSEEERWKVISYIRSYNKEYVQVLSKFDPAKSKLVKINIVFNVPSSLFRVKVTANEKTGIVTLKDAEVVLFANRYFGRLQIDKTLRTNSEGIVIFKFPKDLPGNKAGVVSLIVKVNDDNYGEIESEKKMKIGIPTNIPSLTEKRAIWNVMAKAPVWLIITYISCVLFVGFVLFYILFSLKKLKEAGSN